MLVMVTLIKDVDVDRDDYDCDDDDDDDVDSNSNTNTNNNNNNNKMKNALFQQEYFRYSYKPIWRCLARPRIV